MGNLYFTKTNHGILSEVKKFIEISMIAEIIEISVIPTEYNILANR